MTTLTSLIYNPHSFPGLTIHNLLHYLLLLHQFNRYIYVSYRFSFALLVT